MNSEVQFQPQSPRRYLLLIRHDDSFHPPAGLGAETEAWMAEMDRRGVRLSGHRLTPHAEGRFVHDGDGQTPTDRPSADTFEVAGYDLIEVPDAAQAMEVAAAHPMARWGRIEVRELWEPPSGDSARMLASRPS